MNIGAEKLIAELSPEIDKKCIQINKARRQKALTTLFIIMCVLVVIIPTLLVMLGISILAIVVPIIFISVGFFILLPILLNQQGGRIYERT